MIRIRKVAPDDYEMLASLGRKAFYEAFSEFQDPDDMQAYLDLAFHPDTIKSHIEDKSILFFVAEWAGEPVGYVKLHLNYAPPELKDQKCMQLERIYALKDFIGKKIGKALMEKCISEARAANAGYLWLGVWQENHRAIKFYKDWGFEIIGYKQFVIGKEVNDDYVMALKII